MTQVVKTIERKKEDTHKVKRGWFTSEAMKTELKWDKTLGCQLPCTDYIGVTIFQLFRCRWNKYRYRYDDGRYTAI